MQKIAPSHASQQQTAGAYRADVLEQTRGARIVDLTDGAAIDLAESAIAEPYRLGLHSDRGRELLAEGYPRSVVPFILRLEGRENTLLDFTAARALTAAEEAERRAIARTLDELQALVAPPAPVSEASEASPSEMARMEANGQVEPADYFDHPDAIREYTARHGNRPPRRYASVGHRLHALLGAHGVSDHYAAVSEIVGREVTSLNALSPSEAALVEASFHAEVRHV